FMNPADLKRIGLSDGDVVEIRSRNGAIVGVVQTDKGLRTGVVSLTHGFGRSPGEEADPRKVGANVNTLTRVDEDYDPYSGIPRMGAVPVSVSPLDSE